MNSVTTNRKLFPGFFVKQIFSGFFLDYMPRGRPPRCRATGPPGAGAQIFTQHSTDYIYTGSNSFSEKLIHFSISPTKQASSK